MMPVPIYICIARGSQPKSIVEGMSADFTWRAGGNSTPKLRYKATRFLCHRVTHMDVSDNEVEFYDFHPPQERQSDHAAFGWQIWLLLPDFDAAKAGVKGARNAIKTWVDSASNVGPNGRKVALGPWTPKRFEAQAPAGVVANATGPNNEPQHVISGQDPIAMGLLDDGDLD
jgi:hypothetical protein